MLRTRTISPSSSDKRPSKLKALNPLFALVSAHARVKTAIREATKENKTFRISVNVSWSGSRPFGVPRPLRLRLTNQDELKRVSLLDIV